MLWELNKQRNELQNNKKSESGIKRHDQSLSTIGVYMDGFRLSSSRHLELGLIAVLVFCGACAAWSGHGHGNSGSGVTESQAIQPLSANDVSVLFPAPSTAADVKNLIAVSDITTPNAQDPSKRDPVWPAGAFQQFVAIAGSPSAQVAGTQDRIGLPAEALDIGAWFIAGIRIDAGAPGLSTEIRSQLGQLPQIRLIVQPVARAADGTPRVLDIAGHLIFDFIAPVPAPPAQPDCLPRQSPDSGAFNSVVLDLFALRNKLRDGQLGANKVNTSGVPMGVHPGLLDATTATNLRGEILSFLEKHISGQRLDAMAIAALPDAAPAPWIFLSMVKIPAGLVPALPNGGFIAVHGPTLDGGQQFAQMLQPSGTNPRVVPDPHTNNLSPITCKNAAVSPSSLPIANRNGVATAELFALSPPSPDRTKQVLDVIADPAKSHFFNTDCISCHTETRRAMDLQNIKDIPGINSATLPNGQWNIRNFGWSPSSKGAHATVTRRTANETASVVSAINSGVLAKRPN
jgi:hypothetical protein